MTKLAARIGDRLLNRLAPKAEAGACVFNYQQLCYCIGTGPFALAVLVGCDGVCRRTQLACPL